MPPNKKQEDRLRVLENTMNMVMEVINTRNIVRKDCEVQTTAQNHVDQTTQTTTPVTQAGTQTYCAVNITERGIQVRPKQVCASVQVRVSGTDTATQASIPATSDVFMGKVRDFILPQLNNVERDWVHNEVRNNTFSSNTVESFNNIRRRKFDTDDVVRALLACINMVIVTYGQQSESEYETETESDTEDVPQTATQYQQPPPNPQPQTQNFMRRRLEPPSIPRQHQCGTNCACGRTQQAPAAPFVQQNTASDEQSVPPAVGSLYYKVRQGL